MFDLSPVYTRNNVQATLSNATSLTILSTMSNIASTLLPVSATMSNEISFFRQSRNKFNMFNLFRLCRKEGRNFIRHCCRLWQQSRPLLRQYCQLLRHCCCGGRDLRMADNRCPFIAAPRTELTVTTIASAMQRSGQRDVVGG